LPAVGSGKHTHLNKGQGLNAVYGGYEAGWNPLDDGKIAPTNANLTSCPASTWTNASGVQENLPIYCVNWYESYAFCSWDGGGFLPSEAEWKYAAAGGSQQREYPWGSTAPGTANQYAIFGCHYPSGSPDASYASCSGVANIAPVGTATLGAGLWGQVDMAGEVREWNLDSYALYMEPCTDCAMLQNVSRVFSGGLFFGASSDLPLPPSRGSDSPADRHDSIGLRCARTP